ncbi:S-layer homology domain-containing protein [Veillonella criceti]|uniref:S-layer homology domain n=1 Tax=Veillonella criceti TaxID=103891 RepID=A0A380NMV2_9FIRM|nr:S-layer homology domain-containing protein [Veillonella criceti]SUP43330.1 S-layer homology domain [Veillonella criceti]
MKKNLFTTTLLTAILTTTTSSATNPFTDIHPNNWSYQAITQLAKEGIITGYPNQTFKGDVKITRYEMAQMIAKALAHQEKANAEQLSIINKLSAEFNSELNNLGIKIQNLESNIGNTKISGDMRIRYRGSENKGVFKNNYKSKFDYRARIQFDSKINKNTTAIIRLRTGNTKGDPEFGNANNSDIDFDRIAITHSFTKNFQLALGRTGLRLGEGLAYSNEPFDGILSSYTDKDLQFEVGYGALTSFYASTFPATRNDKRTKIIPNLSSDENPTLTILQLRKSVAKKVNLSAYYLFGNKNINTDFYGIATKIGINKFLAVDGEWLTAKDFDNSSAWVAGITYGNYNILKQDSWDLKLQYFNEDINSPIFTSRYAQAWLRDYKGWLVSTNYAIEKNFGISAFYGFNSKTKDGKSLGNYYRTEFNFKF